MGFSLQYCSVHTVNQLRLSNVSFKVTVFPDRHVTTLKEYFATDSQYFAPCIMSSTSSLKLNKNKNKSKKIQVLSVFLEARSEEQLQQKCSQRKEKKNLQTRTAARGF